MMPNAKDPRSEPTLDLVAAAQGGDRTALDALFERYLPRVRLIVGARMGWSAGKLGDLEDLVQESLLKALTSLKKFDVRSDGKFCNWMSCIVQSAIKDVAKHANAQKRDIRRERLVAGAGAEGLSALIFVDDAPSPSALLKGKELEERLHAALLKLQPHQREVVILRQICGMSYREIAEDLGFEKEATVRVALSRALDKLRKLLEE
jgi:RNA polymerase sigma-70 factor (ECF subfamily)